MIAIKTPIWAILPVCVVIFSMRQLYAVETVVATQYRDSIQPILASYCFDCHADGGSEGGLSFDTAASDLELVGNRDLWWAVLKNVRAGIMPPSEEDRPSPEEQKQLTNWIKTSVFGVDPANLDPGRVTVRRLNRVEYRNTIRDLMGVEFNAEVVFPPDDTGFGFDNVGDALSLSPMLLEKYLQAAVSIVKESVPTVCKVIPTKEFTGKDFRSTAEGDEVDGSRMSYKEERIVEKVVRIDTDGRFRLRIQVKLDGSFDFDPSRCRVVFRADDEELYSAEYARDESKSIEYEFERNWKIGDHRLSFHLSPLNDSEKEPEDEEQGSNTNNNFCIQHVEVEGPTDTLKRVHPTNYERFFTRDEPPAPSEERREYARELLAAFAKRAYRRPARTATLEKLVALAEATYQHPDVTFESGIAQAMTAILASPRFLFRLEAPQATAANDIFPLVDEFSLASRLSYFLWTTMPDAQLLQLADDGTLRANLDAQIERMLKDERSDTFVRNFVGQWLRARDVEHVSLDPLVALGFGEEYEQLRRVFRRRFRRGREDDQSNPVSDEEWEKTRARFRELREIRDKFDSRTRRAMRRETEMLFEHIVREDRTVLDLLDSDYTFLNDRLADLYDIPGVEGSEMRHVMLPKGSPRGGVITQATMLTATSNPTRTSPVKRGLYILDNILGMPSPPAPPDVPELEDAAKKFGDREPPLRELLAAHRESALCSSCHNRMDPLGIALENFNALGMWRETDNKQPVDASGTLVTGESFKDVRELKQILVADHRADFYRCMTQKLMTYALGRGLEYYDEYTVDLIVDRLEQSDGRFSVLLKEVIKSSPFQRQRRSAVDGNNTAMK